MTTGINMRKNSLWRRLLQLILGMGMCAAIFLTAVISKAEVVGPTIEIPDSVVGSLLMPPDSTEMTEDDKASKVAEIPATFPGGIKALFKHINKEISYPRKAAKNKIEGRVLIKFVVNEKGYVTKASVLKGAYPELDAEALRVVKGLPRWNSAWDDGKRVPYYYVLPIQFKIPEGYVPEKNYWFNRICEFFIFLFSFGSGSIPVIPE